MRKKIPFLLCIVLLPLITFGQSKKSLDEAALFSWKSIENRQISDDGKWLTYQLMPNKGDGNLIIMNTRTREEITIERGKQVYIDHHLEKLSCLVSPEETLIDSLKRMKKKEDELPIDTLLILDLKTGEKQLIPNVKSLKTPIKWDGFIIYQLDSDRDTFLEKVLPRKMKKDESVFIIHHLENDQEDTLTYVQALILAEEESVVYFHQNASDSTKLTYIKQLLLPDYDLHEVFSDKGTVSNLGTSRDGKQVTWLFDKDTSHHIIPEYDLYSREMPNEASKIVAEKERKDFIPDNWMISDNFQATYSPDGNRLFFGMAPIPLMPDTTLLPDEIVEVEIWNYQDELLYTQQKVQEKKEKKRTYLACFDFAEHNLVPLGNEETQTIIKHDKLELEWAIGLEDQSMQKYLSWEGRTYKDLFLVSLLDGSKELVAKRISGDPEWSPGGKYIYWYEEPDTAW
ncbi:MAG: hypothetical protein KDC53_22135, partial [Saprospiraceae bacterium]|nr:hypothetical protein [Saprospiraceae bacterium]